MSAGPRAPEHNRLLRALPRTEYRRLLPDLDDVTLPHGHVLFAAGERIRHVYFPQHCIVSLVATVDDGGRRAGAEIGIVGNEGMVGLPVFLGEEVSANDAVSQVPNAARRLTTRAFRRALAGGPGLRRLMLRYAGALLGQVAQGVACQQLHPLEARCARWLLMAHDRVQGDRFALTQQFLAQMLGVERVTISAVARGLRAAGAIDYRRGRVTITDRARLERTSCPCYGVIETAHTRALRRPR